MSLRQALPGARFAGQRAVVTGAARGIGAAIARRLAAEGALVLVTDLDGDGAAKVAAGIGGDAAQLDVTDPAAVAAVLGGRPCDVLVNNAGIDDFGWFTEVSASPLAAGARGQRGRRPRLHPGRASRDAGPPVRTAGNG